MQMKKYWIARVNGNHNDKVNSISLSIPISSLSPLLLWLSFTKYYTFPSLTMNGMKTHLYANKLSKLSPTPSLRQASLLTHLA